MNDTLELLKTVKYVYEPVKDIADIEYYLYIRDGVYEVLLEKETIIKSTDYIEVFNTVIALNLNLETIDKILIASLMMRYVYLTHKAKKIMDVIGADVATQALVDWEDFCNTLKKAIKKETNPLRVVE